MDVLLGPEMKSTGEVMGIDQDFGWAFAKSQAGAGAPLPKGGTAFISVKESDRPAALEVAKQLKRLGFKILGTRGTVDYLHTHGLEVETVNKVKEGRPHIVDHIKNGQIALVVNTVRTASAHADSLSIRREALNKGLAYYTTIRGARAAVMGIEAILKKELTIRSLQEYHHARSDEVMLNRTRGHDSLYCSCSAFTRLRRSHGCDPGGASGCPQAGKEECFADFAEETWDYGYKGRVSPPSYCSLRKIMPNRSRRRGRASKSSISAQRAVESEPLRGATWRFERGGESDSKEPRDS